MGQTPRVGLRVLIGAGSFADAASALRLIERLPKAFRVSLGGVFVEEPDTLETCRVPNQRMVTKSGMTMLAPDPTQVRTILRAEARAFQRTLAHAGDRDANNDLFFYHQGDLLSTALSAARGWDVLVVGYRPVVRIRGSIIALQGAGKQTDQLGVAAQSLSHRFSANYVSFLIGSGTHDDDHAHRERTKHFETLDAGLRALARTNAMAVLVDFRDGPITTQTDLARVFEAARCPLIVFGASRQTTQLEHSMQIPPSPENDGRADDP